MQFQNITLSYGERTILKNINLDIKKWEFVFLIGWSWSGKTSFIRAIIGAKKIKNGHIINDDGKDIAQFSPKKLLQYRRNLGTIFQDFKLLPRKTVKENVSFAMEVSGYSKKEINQKVPEVLSKVWLLSKQNKFIETLSGWEVQRTCIARALIHAPDIIIGDEPTWNLDRHNAMEVMALLENLNQQGKTIIMATHDNYIVNEMKKRVIAFKDGTIFSDTPKGQYNL